MKPSPDFALLDRRQWIRRFMLGSAAALGLGRTWRGVLLAELTPGVSASDILPVSISQYQDLLDFGGSVQLQLTNLTAPITITRGLDNGEAVFFAVDARCTHNGCTVGKFEGAQMLCPCHQSTYAMDGTLIYGFAGPGQGSLRKFNTEFDGLDLLKVEVPGLNLRIDAITVQTSTPTSRRLRLTFPALAGADYRVRYTPDLVAPAVAVPFATTAGGAATQTQLHIFGLANVTVNVWVDNAAARGFYEIELVVGQFS